MKFNSEKIPASLNDPSAQRSFKQNGGIFRKNAMHHFTYQQLRNAYESKVNLENGKVPGSVKNMNSSLNAFVIDTGNDFESVIGAEFGDSHYKYLNEHLMAQRSQGRSEQNLRDRKSHIKRYRGFYLGLKRENADQLSPFQEVIRQYLKDLPLKPLALQAGIPVSTINRWRLGAVPTKRSLATVRRLENFLALTPGTFTEHLPNNIKMAKVTEVPDNKIPYRENLSKQTKDPYRLKTISENLHEEWLTFLDYKTTQLPLGLKRQKKGRWSASSTTFVDNDIQTKMWFAVSAGTFIPSAAFNWLHVTAFFGWLNKHSGIENDDAIQSMALLADKQLIEKYISWRLRRSDNKLNGAHLCFVTFMLSLVHPETGYLTQNTDMKYHLNKSITNIEWIQQCDALFKLLKDLESNIRSSMKRSRNPFEPIAQVIALDNPLLAIKDMISRMKADRPTPGTVQEAIWARDLLLINVIICTPLRLGNLRSISYKADNTGNLYFKNDNWHLRISAEDFKNRNSTAKDIAFDIELSAKLKSDIDRYLKNYRPKLIKSQVQDGPLFVSSKKQTINGWKSLSRRIETLTRDYLMRCPGVGSHAVRHIVATAIIKASGDFSTAALVLHDREDTVRKNYAHLIPQDGYRKYRAMFPDM